MFVTLVGSSIVSVRQNWSQKSVKGLVTMQINMNDNVMLVSQTSPLGVDFFHYWNGFFYSNKYAKMLARWVKTPYTEIHWFQSTFMFRSLSMVIHGRLLLSTLCYLRLFQISAYETQPQFFMIREDNSPRKGEGLISLTFVCVRWCVPWIQLRYCIK